MLKRTPILGIAFAAVIAYAIIFFFELPERPFTSGDLIILFFLSYLVGLGFALLLDPKAKETKENLLKINFYEEK